MTAPAMPSAARLIGRSLLLLRQKGYNEAYARQIIKDVVESMVTEKGIWEPWAIDWWRRLWVEAHGTGATPRTPTPQPGKDHNG